MGRGTASSAYTILSAAPPTQMTKPTVTKSLSTTDVTFNWTAPSNNGDTIIAYKLLILDSTAIFREAPSLCNGA